MPARRRLKKEEKEELDQKKKALKKSFKKDFAGSKRVGSSRISDTRKWILIATAIGVIAVLISVVFLVTPPPYCYYTEVDYVYSTLDQDTQNLTFDYILAWYKVRPRYATVSCNIVDYYNTSYDVELPPNSSLLVPGTYPPDEIWYLINEITETLTFESKLENGTALSMATWINSTTIETSPTSITRNVRTEVNFKIELETLVALDSYNISLKIDRTQVNTTIEHKNTTSGSHSSGTYYIKGTSLPADSLITLEFNLYINTTLPWAELNLLESGEAHLVMEDQLLKDFSGASDFKKSTFDFNEMISGEDPTLVRSEFLDVVIDVPYFNITLS